MKDVIIIGAGPCGLSAAIECQRQGLSSLIIEKNFIVHSIYLYPTNMQFFSTTPLLEIGDVPFTSRTTSHTAMKPWSITAALPRSMASTSPPMRRHCPFCRRRMAASSYIHATSAEKSSTIAPRM